MNIRKQNEIIREQLHNHGKYCMLVCNDVFNKSVSAIALPFEDYKGSALNAKEYFDKKHEHGRLVYYHVLKGNYVKGILESI